MFRSFHAHRMTATPKTGAARDHLDQDFSTKAAPLRSRLARTLLVAAAVTGAASAANVLPPPVPQASTVPANGDVNPYGVAFVPRSVPQDGLLKPGGILVSNFNNAQNLQGTGITIVQIFKDGTEATFFQGQPGLGLTAALGIFSDGLVVVGNLPTSDGTSNTARAGSLIFIDRKGHTLGQFTDPNLVQGPWGLAIVELGEGRAFVFYTNVLNGTIIRLGIIENGEVVEIVSATVLASGLNHRADPAALELGPSGVAYDAAHEILYFANSADNTIYAIGDADSASGASVRTVVQDLTHLHGPLDVVLAPNGHLIVANSDGSNADPNQPSELEEFTVDGQFVTQFSVDPNNGGAFGVGIHVIGPNAIELAAVDDNQNILRMWTEVLY